MKFLNLRRVELAIGCDANGHLKQLLACIGLQLRVRKIDTHTSTKSWAERHSSASRGRVREQLNLGNLSRGPGQVQRLFRHPFWEVRRPVPPCGRYSSAGYFAGT